MTGLDDSRLPAGNTDFQIDDGLPAVPMSDAPDDWYTEAAATMLGNPLLAEAWHYAARGWKVLPLHTPLIDSGKVRCSCKEGAACDNIGKHPRYDENTLAHGAHSATSNGDLIGEWWDKWPRANIGLATGKASGLVVLDVDPRHGGDDTLAMLERQHGKLPATVEAVTGGGGRHLFFAYHPIGNKVSFAPGLDTRSDGGLIVASPSLHASGNTYQWEVSAHPDDMQLAPMPQWLIDLITAAGANSEPTRERSAQPTGSDKIPNGQRNNTLASLAGSMRRRGMGQDAIEAALLVTNRDQCDPPLAEDEVKRIARSVTQYDPAGERCELTDLGNARRFALRYADQVKYVGAWGWLFDSGQRWQRDDVGRIAQFARTVVRAIFAEAQYAATPDTAKAIGKWAANSQARHKIDDMLKLAKDEPEIVTTPDKFDRDLMLLNCPNGAINLRTGQLHPHNPADYITRLAGADFDPDAACPIWLSFLDRIMAGNARLISFLQRAIGYSLTGDTGEQVLFFCHGSGANGKSVLIETWRRILGDYAQAAEFSTFLARQSDTIRNDVARLAGARFVAAIEAGDGRRLSEVLVKSLTGGDTVSARFLHHEYFEFRPQFKLWLAANTKPGIKGTDYAIWRRIRLIPFTVTIPENERDPRLAEKLRAELPGILAWAVRGCLDWQRSGLGTPDEVTSATAAYRAESDTLANFIGECCVTGENVKTAAGAMHKAYCAYSGEKISAKEFKRMMLDHGYKEPKHGKTGSVWHGIGLLDLLSETPNRDG